ncbi:hypothetical protein [Streptomyces goshikiensis]|uniref:hypothetical protein n=1 Tax=Streptomyces goshikiensis TaxID=1942 RepID=UPI003715760B
MAGAQTRISESSAPHGSEQWFEAGWFAGVRDVASYLLRIADTTTAQRGRAASGRGPGSRPLTIAAGFSYGTYRFDAVAAAAPSVHGYHHGRNEALNEVVSAVFPAYQCEFRGDESPDEAVLRFKRMLQPTIISRPPAPYLRMRYENTRTDGGSVGPSRGFITHDVLRGGTSSGTARGW